MEKKKIRTEAETSWRAAQWAAGWLPWILTLGFPVFSPIYRCFVTWGFCQGINTGWVNRCFEREGCKTAAVIWIHLLETAGQSTKWPKSLVRQTNYFSFKDETPQNVLNRLLTGVLERFLEYISRASASITPPPVSEHSPLSVRPWEKPNRKVFSFHSSTFLGMKCVSVC